jgi:hypothetical protein
MEWREMVGQKYILKVELIALYQSVDMGKLGRGYFDIK